MIEESLQERFAPHSRCFGCGPANHEGLRLRSIPLGDTVVATWVPAERHQAFPGMVNGGILGSLLDCHSNWTAAWHLMQRDGAPKPPCTVTAEYFVKLHRPTPLDLPLELVARLQAIEGNRVTIAATLSSADKVRATCQGVFVAVSAGHPAFHQW